MRFLTTSALGLALAFAGAAAPVMAKEKAAAEFKLTDSVRKSLAAAQEQQKAGNHDAAIASLNEAKAAIATPDDRFLTYQLMYASAQAKQDSKLQVEAIDQMLQSGKVPAESVGKFNMALGQLAYNNQDYTKAEQAFAKAIELDPNAKEAYALLAESKYKLRKPAEAVAVIQQVVDRSAAAGSPVPQEWVARGIAIGTDAKLGDPVANLSYSWLTNYSTKTNWRDSLLIYRDLHPMDADLNLDLMRLQRAVGALKGERDFAEYVESTYIKFPGEAKAVIDQGVSSGALNLAQSPTLREYSAVSNGKIAADKASLKKSATTGRSALATADAYMGYGDFTSAIEMYHKATSLGGVDANIVNLRLAAALVQSNHKDEAKQLLASITGPRAALARYWTIFIDHPPTA